MFDWKVERMHRTMKKNKKISLGLLPYWEVTAGTRIEVFINGESRGIYLPSNDAKLYTFLDYVKNEEDELPF